MKKAFNLDNLKISEVFEKWNEGDLSGYLLEITSKILKYKENNEYLVDKILDIANQKALVFGHLLMLLNLVCL